MRDVVIKTGVYGRRDEKGRVLPVAKGERVTLSDEEAARLVALDVAVYADIPARAPSVPPAPPPGGEEDDSADAEVTKLERMQKVDLEQMAADMGLDISGVKTKHDLAVLIVATGEPDGGEAPPDLGAGDIVQ